MEKNPAKATGFQSRAAETTFLFVPVLKKNRQSCRKHLTGKSGILTN
jgi:hypothetical protein